MISFVYSTLFINSTRKFHVYGDCFNLSGCLIFLLPIIFIGGFDTAHAAARLESLHNYKIFFLLDIVFCSV